MAIIIKKRWEKYAFELFYVGFQTNNEFLSQNKREWKKHAKSQNKKSLNKKIAKTL